MFLQFDQAADGFRMNLPAPPVDTGAGLARIAAVIQEVPPNFDTDLFMAIIDRAQDVTEREYERGPEWRWWDDGGDREREWGQYVVRVGTGLRSMP